MAVHLQMPMFRTCFVIIQEKKKGYDEAIYRIISIPSKDGIFRKTAVLFINMVLLNL